MEYSNGFPRKRDVSLEELSQRLAEFAEVRGWDQYHSPRNLLLALVSPMMCVIYDVEFFLKTVNEILDYAGWRGGRAF